MATGQSQRPLRKLQSKANSMADIQDNDTQEEVGDSGGDKRHVDTSVLLAMQKSLGKAMDELGHVSKLILILTKLKKTMLMESYSI